MPVVFKSKLTNTTTENAVGKSEIQEFFKGCNVFLTGGTGFLGKLILEKLLRSCKDIFKIYLLVREKKGKNPENRLEELFKPVMFDGIKETDPKCLKKVVLIEGDCSLPNLGLSEENQQKILNDVNCIFHCAATVRFDEKIRTAAYINVRATRDLLVISKNIKNLKSFVYISTAYCHCPQTETKEEFYEPGIRGDKLLFLVEALKDNVLEKITPKLLGEWPNAYVFTKAVAEQVVRDYGKDLPIAVIRPSAVISTVKEPVAGWIDNVYGPIGTSVAVTLGLVRVTRADKDRFADVVPADYVINCSIAVAWEIGSKKNCNGIQENTLNENGESTGKANSVVYNYTSSSQNPLTFKAMAYYVEKEARQVPSPLTIWYPFMMYASSNFSYRILIFLLHTVPAYVADFIAYCIGKQPLLIKGYQKIHKFFDVAIYFSTREWNFPNKNTQRLWKKLNEEDKSLFAFDIGTLKWSDYFRMYIRGGRVYLLKDPMDTVPQGERNNAILKTIHYVLVSVLLLGLFKLVSSLTTNVLNIVM